jgi:Ser/Thr protein kinase RdoA (MazF antagonist)
MTDDKLLLKISKKYDLEEVNFLSPQKGYRNESHPLQLKDGQVFNLIIHKGEPDALAKIKAANFVSGYLAKSGFPTRVLIDKRIVQIKSKKITKYCLLYSYLPGRTIPWEAYTMKHIKNLGATISDMHGALAHLDPANLLPHVSSIYPGLLDKMIKYFSLDGVKLAMLAKLKTRLDLDVLEKLKNLIRISTQLPLQQPLHLDFVRGNILFDQTKSRQLVISGILDFEKTAVGNTIFDIARTLAFLLVDCKFKPEAKIRKYFLESGYNKRGQSNFTQPLVDINGTKVNLFEELVSFYLLYDFYKFLLHNPYEFLAQNEHYLRTRDYLVADTKLLMK